MSSVTRPSRRATSVPVICTWAEKQALVAFTTITTAPDFSSAACVGPTNTAVARTAVATASVSGCFIQAPSWGLASDAKTIGVIAYVGVVTEARGGADITCLAVERAAAQHALPALARRPGGAVARRPAIVVVPAILDPFGSIAGGVEQAERIGREASRCGRLLSGIGAALAAVGETVADVTPPPIRRLGAATRRIFPLGFARQAIALPGLLRQPRDVGLHVAPADIDHRALAATLPAIVGAMLAGAGGDALFPLVEGDLPPADGEGLG